MAQRTPAAGFTDTGIEQAAAKSTPAGQIQNQRQFCEICVQNSWLNPWLINELRSTKDYVRKNKLFMQNKPNFQKVKYDVNVVLTKDYDQMDTWSIRITKPIKANKSQ